MPERQNTAKTDTDSPPGIFLQERCYRFGAILGTTLPEISQIDKFQPALLPF
jgi:hypothetical protein